MYTLRVEDRFFDTPNEFCFEKLEESQTHSLNVKGGQVTVMSGPPNATSRRLPDKATTIPINGSILSHDYRNMFEVCNLPTAD